MLNLLIQSADITTADLKSLAKPSGATRIERITGTAFRLRDVREATEVEALCARARLDHAYVPAGRRLSQYGLAVTDMDSTLITIECIDEIADLQGLKREVAAITAAAMRGEIDYAFYTSVVQEGYDFFGKIVNMLLFPTFPHQRIKERGKGLEK